MNKPASAEGIWNTLLRIGNSTVDLQHSTGIQHSCNVALCLCPEDSQISIDMKAAGVSLHMPNTILVTSPFECRAMGGISPLRSRDTSPAQGSQ